MKKRAVAVYLTTSLIIGCIVILGTNISLAGTVDLPRTGQTTCYNDLGDEISCAGTGQDGDIQAGVEWPETRFTDNLDGTITDNLTGLMWLKDANCFATLNWQGALDAIKDLNDNPESYSCGGYTATYGDWVLPNVNELESLINSEESNPASWLNSQGFLNVALTPHSDYYWSSTSPDKATHDHAWEVNIAGSYVQHTNKDKVNPPNYVWPVRAASSAPAQLWQTGQTTCYDSSGDKIDCDGTGQDGDIQGGIEWPNPRFMDNGDGTVTDNLTGLMWLKDASCIGEKTWQMALGAVVELNDNPGDYTCEGYIEKYDDWHLPNRKELHSLTDYSQYDPALPVEHLFKSVQSDIYWSSTTAFPNGTATAWTVDMEGGHLYDSYKPINGNPHYVWPVRTGGAEPPENQPPVADSGADQIVSGEVELDGSQSSDPDPDDEIVSYAWELKHREYPSYNKIADGVNPTVSDLGPGYYDVTLTVTDDEGLTGKDTMLLAVSEQCEGWPQSNANLDTKKLEIKKNSNKATIKVDGTINLPDLAVSDGDTVESRITVELFGVLPGDNDLVISSEDTLEVKHKKNLEIKKKK